MTVVLMVLHVAPLVSGFVPWRLDVGVLYAGYGWSGSALLYL